MSTHAEEQHHVPYKVYFIVWGALLVLTAVTVGVSYVDMKNVTVLTAMLIASAKSMLVLLYFMHLKNESKLLKLSFVGTIFALAVLIGFLFWDVAFR